MGICMGIYTYACVPILCRSHRYKLVHSGMHIGVAMGYRINSGCRVQVQGELVMLTVYVEL